MDSPDFATLLAALRGLVLRHEDHELLRSWLATVNDAADCIAMIDQAGAEKCCPRCGSARAHRCGRASGLQRWRCIACGRSYNALTGTTLARLRKKECWISYFQCLLDSRTVRASAENQSGLNRGRRRTNANSAFLCAVRFSTLGNHIWNIYTQHTNHIWSTAMGIVNIEDDLHDQVRLATKVSCRSINAQAAFWIKIGMLCETNPTLSFNQIVGRELAAAGVSAPPLVLSAA